MGPASENLNTYINIRQLTQNCYLLIQFMYLLRMGQVNFLPSGQVFGVMILLGSDYGSVDFSSGQQILTSGLVEVQFHINLT